MKMDVNDIENLENMTLHDAVNYNRLDVLQKILKQPQLMYNKQNRLEETPLLYSLKINRSDKFIATLIDHGCDVNIPDKYNQMPLHLAAQRKTDLIVLKLLQNGADVNSKDGKGSTPLHKAVAKGRIQNVYVLLYYNACVDEKNSMGMTPFSFVFKEQYSWHEIARILMDYVVDFNERDDDGYTLLHRALKNHSVVTLDIIERGGDVNLLLYGNHCINFSFKIFGSSAIFEAIWRRTNYELLLRYNCTKKPLLEMFLDYNSLSNDDFLRCFYMIFETSVIKNFIKQFLDNEQNSENLIYDIFRSRNIAFAEKIKMLYLLLSYGVEIYFLDVALFYKEYGFDKIVALLLKHCCQIRQNKSITDHSRYRTCSVSLLISKICYNDFNIYSEIPNHKLRLNQNEIQNYSRFYKVNFNTENISHLVRFDNSWHFHKLNEVPSLLQLSRDIVRKIIYTNFRTLYSFNVYEAISKLPVPAKIKNILFLKEAIY